MPKKIVLSFLVVLLAAGLSACSVMQGTYQKKVDEGDTLTKRLAALQKKHDDLAAENAALKDPETGFAFADRMAAAKSLIHLGRERRDAAALEQAVSILKGLVAEDARNPAPHLYLVHAQGGLGSVLGKPELHRAAAHSAKDAIDLLGILQEKTNGNLTKEEEEVLREGLYHLRMGYVALLSAPPGGPKKGGSNR